MFILLLPPKLNDRTLELISQLADVANLISKQQQQQQQQQMMEIIISKFQSSATKRKKKVYIVVKGCELMARGAVARELTRRRFNER